MRALLVQDKSFHSPGHCPLITYSCHLVRPAQWAYLPFRLVARPVFAVPTLASEFISVARRSDTHRCRTAHKEITISCHSFRQDGGITLDSTA